MKKVDWITLGILFLIVWYFIEIAKAEPQRIMYKCEDFDNRVQLKDYLTKHPEALKKLDRDGDGIACESLQQ